MPKRYDCPICGARLKRAHARLPRDSEDDRPVERLSYKGIGYYCANCRYIEADKERESSWLPPVTPP